MTLTKASEILNRPPTVTAAEWLVDVREARMSGEISRNAYAMALKIATVVEWQAEAWDRPSGIYRDMETALKECDATHERWRKLRGELYDAGLITRDEGKHENVVIIRPERLKQGKARPANSWRNVIQERGWYFEGANRVPWEGSLEDLPF